jgi:hypothetical protein
MSAFSRIDSMVNKLAKNYTLWVIGLIVIMGLIAAKAYVAVFPRLPDPPVYGEYRVLQPEVVRDADPLLKTGWSEKRRERYYQSSQGSLVVPYIWYQSLEYRTGRQMFASPQIQVKYGLLPDTENQYNLDVLPVGIIKDIVPDEYVNDLGEGHKEWASISCAACHTGQIVYRGTAMRVDGGQSFWGFEQWSGDLVFSLMLTSASPSKFERFCSRVYGHPRGTKCLETEKQSLRKQLKAYFDSDLITGAINALMNHTYASTEGFTRTAALGRGVNGETGLFDSKRNIKKNSGPVSFPPLWYTHDFDWVQSPAAIRQPLGRNVTEAWGVSVRVNLDINNPDKSKLFTSTARLDDMFWIETMLSILPAPKWDETILPKINWDRARNGRRLYNDVVWESALPQDQAELQSKDLTSCCPASPGPDPNKNRPKTGYCARCHAPVLEENKNQYGRQYIQLPIYRLDVMGTDPHDADQFAAVNPYTGAFADPVFGGQKQVGVGEFLNTTITRIMNKWFDTHTVPPDCRIIMEAFRPNIFRAPHGYPARPLDGYWATGPFLHNGSVRTIYQLLSPSSEREKSFWIGSREFDPDHLGYENEPVPGAFRFDTTLEGNSNAGHEFRDAPRGTPAVIGPLLSREERLDIIEYLKVLAFEYEYKDLNVDKDKSIAVAARTPDANLRERNKILDAMSRYYEDYDPAKSRYGTYQLMFERENQKENEENQRTIGDFCKGLVKGEPVAAAGAGSSSAPGKY